ncbi:hypothetical protein AAZX31_04G021300 [Glycine max]
MKDNPIFYVLLLFLGESRSSSADIIQAGNGSDDDTNRELYIVNEKAPVRNFKHGFSGFAARLTKEEANSIAQKPRVVSVFPDPILKLLHTTRSCDFLKDQSTPVKIHHPNTVYNSAPSSDVIIGILDSDTSLESQKYTYIDITRSNSSASAAAKKVKRKKNQKQYMARIDKGMGPVPCRWKGTCMKSYYFYSSNCNRKIIGARHYPDPQGDSEYETPRDKNGHGTHVASTAAGATVPGASYYGVAAGTAQSGSPKSLLAIYKVCFKYECPGSAVLAAFDDAIADGVDVISLSVASLSELKYNPIAIGAFHAVERGILVVASAGNNGPSLNTVVKDSQSIKIFIVIKTILKIYLDNLLLKYSRWRSLKFLPSFTFPKYPLIYSESAQAKDAKLSDARQCFPYSLDKVKGKIVAVQGVSGIRVVHIFDPIGGTERKDFGDFPVTEINNPVATILPTVSVIDFKPAPMMPSFAAKGPSAISKNILKPEITAPGVNILAAWIGNDKEGVPKGKKPSQFNIKSGTSMACSHVSGLAATIKSQNPTWSASAIKSATMATVTQENNLKAPITTDKGSVATPYDYGAGQMTIYGAFHPGLVYETNTIDYLNYLCYVGFNITLVKTISRNAPNNLSCPKHSSSHHISNINYPSIAISDLKGKELVDVNITVTNVGEEDETLYSPVVDAPIG